MTSVVSTSEPPLALSSLYTTFTTRTCGDDANITAYKVDKDGTMIAVPITNGLADDEDFDRDGVPNAADNCKLGYNPDQMDVDWDYVGDVCDNCPEDSNPDQADGNEDAIGDACQP